MQNLDYFRGIAEWILKVYLSMEAESVIGVSDSCDLAWPGLKSMHFTLEVSIFPKKVSIFDWRDAHRCHHARTKRTLFLKNAGPPV